MTGIMIAKRCSFKTKLEGEKRASLSKQATRTAPPISSTPLFPARAQLGRSLYQLELPLLQFILGAGTAALGWLAVQFWTASVNFGFCFCGVEQDDAGGK